MPVAPGPSSPRLPDGVPEAGAGRLLRAGCHLLEFTDELSAGSVPVRYLGTLRVERPEAGIVASGDLYLHGPAGARPDLLPEEPDPAAGIPVFPRSRYRHYVRVTEVREPSASDDDLALGFELHRFDERSNSWSPDGEFTARLRRGTAAEGVPGSGDLLSGEVRDPGGGHAGQLAITWVSPFLRRAVVEIDCVAGCERPLANAAGLGWRTVFEEVGWDLRIVESEAELPKPSGESWSATELHAAMLARRDSADLDSEWRYWLVCVQRLDGEDRGLMFDERGGDSNNIPREAAAIASHWPIPQTRIWGLVQGMRFGEATDPYFRTALHEVGHAMGLQHNTGGSAIMRPTDTVAERAVPPQQFPQNIVWSHWPEDRRRLSHMPDLWVRPGGVPFGAFFSTAPELPADAVAEVDGLRLDASPLMSAVPIGAPARVNLTLHNADAAAVAAPAELSLKGGHVRGHVTDPAGTVRSFRSLLRRTEPLRVEDIAPGESRAGSMTLLRGREGALFAMPGPHSVHVELEWKIDGIPVRAEAETMLMVLPARDSAHADAALKVLATPDALITLALGGDHLEDGIAAIHAALANDVLRPHFAYVEARRLAAPFQARPPDLAGAADLIEPGTVMSPAEVDKATRLVATAAEYGEAPPEGLVGTLRSRAEAIDSRPAVDRLAAL